MANLNRQDMETRYQMFEYFALRDQRTYYQRTVEKHNTASAQVNRIRATISLFTGIAAAVAGLLVAVYFTSTGVCSQTLTGVPGFCGPLSAVVDLTIILSVALPALGGFFGTLADLYQWDRQISIYKSALQSIEVADAHSPFPEMDDVFYRASLNAYALGTLQVMSDETAQWGQSIRTPKSLEIFVEEERKKAEAVGGDANAGREVDNLPPVQQTVLPDKPVNPTNTVASTPTDVAPPPSDVMPPTDIAPEIPPTDVAALPPEEPPSDEPPMDEGNSAG